MGELVRSDEGLPYDLEVLLSQEEDRHLEVFVCRAGFEDQGDRVAVNRLISPAIPRVVGR